MRRDDDVTELTASLTPELANTYISLFEIYNSLNDILLEGLNTVKRLEHVCPARQSLQPVSFGNQPSCRWDVPGSRTWIATLRPEVS